MTTTLETIALIIALGIAVTTTTTDTNIETGTTTVVCAEPGTGGVYPPPPTN
ncbi:MAG: hypothetical protein HYV29_04555 [Ignavibacteriales bacterium]|nr:hypothetical protein [Ignavibacteriales bacterium]